MFGWPRGLSALRLSRAYILGFALAFAVFGLYFWHLGSLTKGLSPAEAAARDSSASLYAIIDNPAYAPHKLLQYAAQQLFGSGALALRLVSALLALLFIYCFFVICKNWFGKFIAALATLFLAVTPLVILMARSASPEILLLAPLAVLASFFWLMRSQSTWVWLILCITAGLSFYVPGMAIILLLALLFGRAKFAEATSELKIITKIFGGLVFLAVLLPLIYAALKQPAALKALALVPANFPKIIDIFKSAAWSVLSLVWRTPTHMDLQIGRLPILDGAQIALAFFGVAAMWNLARSKLYWLSLLVVVGIIAATLNQKTIFLVMALPSIAILVAAGLRYLYIEWSKVFPRNPLPKYLAVGLMLLLGGFHLYYGWHYSLSAWPNTTTTRTTYVLK